MTAAEQSAGRGRQGRTWSAPRGDALLCSVVLRDPPRLLPLVAGVAVARAVGDRAGLKWPNDVHVDGRKVAGVLVEGRPQESWAVVGVGVNVAVSLASLPPELSGTAGTLGLAASDVEVVLAAYLLSLDALLGVPASEVLDAWRALDVLRGRAVVWAAGSGVASGVDGEGRLVVELSDGSRVALDAGEVHLAVHPRGG